MNPMMGMGVIMALMAGMNSLKSHNYVLPLKFPVKKITPGLPLCNMSNYLDYIYTSDLTDKHIQTYEQGCSLEMANLSGADLNGVDLRWASLSGADLSGADLRWANLSGADLRVAHLVLADLSGADLSGADLRWADLHFVNLTEANLSGADLRKSHLRWANHLKGAKYNSATLFPHGFSPADHRMIEISNFQ